jgi:Spy/CpxP family protein refolding chaperone
MRAAIAGLKGLTLDRSQKDQLARLRADSERQITQAKRELETMSNRLHETLGDLGASEADVARQIDQISAKEATIRKARILAWFKVRGILGEEQRRKVEAAARRHH